MKTSQNGINFIKQHEGLKLETYTCSAGKLTIGYGHTSGVTPGMKITEKQAEDFLCQDLKRFESALNKLVIVPLTQNQFDALVSFTFNNGENAFTNSTLRRKLNSKDYLGAASEFGRWVYVQDPKTKKMVVSEGLKNRRIDEKNLFCK